MENNSSVESVRAGTDSMVLSAAQVKDQVNLIQRVMRDVFIGPSAENPGGVHYGPAYGGGNKNVLLKAGAEKLCLTFRLAPRITMEKTVRTTIEGWEVWDFFCKTELIHIPTGQVLGEGIGYGSTDEEKFAWEAALDEEYAATPETHRRLKYKKVWDKRANGGKGGNVAGNPIKQIRTNPATVANTVGKMTKKRSLIDVVITATAAGDIFTQDLEENAPEPERKPPEMPQERRSPAEATQSKPRGERPATVKSQSETKESGPSEGSSVTDSEQHKEMSSADGGSEPKGNGGSDLPLGEDVEKHWVALTRLAQAVGDDEKFWRTATEWKNKDGKVSFLKSRQQAEDKIRKCADNGWEMKFILPWLIQSRNAYLADEEQKLLVSFYKLGIHSAQLETYLNKAFFNLSGDEIDDLWNVYKEVKAGTPFDEVTNVNK